MQILHELPAEDRKEVVDKFNNMTVAPTQSEIHTFTSGMIRSTDADNVRYDLIPNEGLKRIAATLQKGAVKYGEHNWKKGMPVGECLNHAIRHIYKYLEGDKTEDHLAHASCNLLFCMYYEAQEE